MLGCPRCFRDLYTQRRLPRSTERISITQYTLRRGFGQTDDNQWYRMTRKSKEFEAVGMIKIRKEDDERTTKEYGNKENEESRAQRLKSRDI